jgi:myo-inositol-1-phosphate synthase
MTVIKVAIVGVGNCASSLVQGVAYYTRERTAQGMIQPTVGGYTAADVEFVLGIDVDARKVGHDLAQAIFAGPNNTTVFFPDVPQTGAKVIRGKRLDGVADHMTQDAKRGVQIDPSPDASQAEIVSALRESGAQVLVNFLPVGSHEATEFYMNCALEAGVAVVNCIPVFIASDSTWEARFRERGLPIVGDDIKAQVGATIVHRTLASLFGKRGVEIERTYQLNTGGNTDFMNMLDRDRLGSKKQSKTEAVQAALAQRLQDENIRIGPSEYVPWQEDNKVCFLRLEATQWGGVPLNLELRLSVEDSPNAAACVIDAIRYCRVALDRGLGGVLTAPSAFYCKHPPVQMAEEVAMDLLGQFDGLDALAAE